MSLHVFQGLHSNSPVVFRFCEGPNPALLFVVYFCSCVKFNLFFINVLSCHLSMTTFQSNLLFGEPPSKFWNCVVAGVNYQVEFGKCGAKPNTRGSGAQESNEAAVSGSSSSFFLGSTEGLTPFGLRRRDFFTLSGYHVVAIGTKEREGKEKERILCCLHIHQCFFLHLHLHLHLHVVVLHFGRSKTRKETRCRTASSYPCQKKSEEVLQTISWHGLLHLWHLDNDETNIV